MKIRVYYEDTDCGNVVYYANYLKYMERSRTEILRERGIDLAAWREQGIQFAVVDAAIKYRASAKYDDLLDVETTVGEMTSVTVRFLTTIRNDRGTVLVTGDVRLACIGEGFKATKIPREIAEKMREPSTPAPSPASGRRGAR